MQIDTARTVVEEMRACFTEVGLSIVNEDEMLDHQLASDKVVFRSCLSKNESLSEVLAVVNPDHGVVLLSLNFYKNAGDSIQLELMKLMKFMNFSSKGSFWTLTGNEGRIEFGKMFGVLAGEINREHLVGVLKNFLERGFEQYSYIRRLLQGHEKASKLIRELKIKMRNQQ
jgi:hypothetical protein